MRGDSRDLTHQDPSSSGVLGGRKDSSGLSDANHNVSKQLEDSMLAKGVKRQKGVVSGGGAAQLTRHWAKASEEESQCVRSSLTLKEGKRAMGLQSVTGFKKPPQLLSKIWGSPEEPGRQEWGEVTAEESRGKSPMRKEAKGGEGKAKVYEAQVSDSLDMSAMRLSKVKKNPGLTTSHISLSKVIASQHYVSQPLDNSPFDASLNSSVHGALDNSLTYQHETSHTKITEGKTRKKASLTFNLGKPKPAGTKAYDLNSSQLESKKPTLSSLFDAAALHQKKSNFSDAPDNFLVNTVGNGFEAAKRIDQSPQRRRHTFNYPPTEHDQAEDQQTPELGSVARVEPDLLPDSKLQLLKYTSIQDTQKRSKITPMWAQDEQTQPAQHKIRSKVAEELSHSEVKASRKDSANEYKELGASHLQGSGMKGIHNVLGRMSQKPNELAEDEDQLRNSSFVLNKSVHLKTEPSQNASLIDARKAVGKSMMEIPNNPASRLDRTYTSLKGILKHPGDPNSNVLYMSDSPTITSEIQLPSTPKTSVHNPRPRPLQTRVVEMSENAAPVDIRGNGSPGDVSMLQLSKRRTAAMVSQSNVKTVKKQMRKPLQTVQAVPRDVSEFDATAEVEGFPVSRGESNLNRSFVGIAKKKPLADRFLIEVKGSAEMNKSMELPKHYGDGDTKDSGDHYQKAIDAEDEEIDSEADKLVQKILAISGGAKKLSQRIADFFRPEDEKEVADPDAPILELNITTPTAKKLKAEDFVSKIEHYELLKCVGQGTFAKVHMANQVLTGVKVAVKTVSKKSLAQDENVRSKVESEVELMKLTIGCPRLLRLWECFETKDYMFLVTEYASDGDLLDKINKEGPVAEDAAKEIFKDLVDGLEYLHKHRIVHRDLKLENILLSKGKVKLGDLGISRKVRPGDLLTDSCGTPTSQAPEAICGQPYDGFEADVWGLGVVLYHMVFGRVPFRADSIEDLYLKIKQEQVEFPAKGEVSPALKDLIRRLLQKDPKRRLTIAQVKEHLWLDRKSTATKQEQAKAQKDDKLALSVISRLGYQKWMVLDGIKSGSLCYGVACYHALRQSL